MKKSELIKLIKPLEWEYQDLDLEHEYFNCQTILAIAETATGSFIITRDWENNKPYCIVYTFCGYGYVKEIYGWDTLEFAQQLAEQSYINSVSNCFNLNRLKSICSEEKVSLFKK